MKIAVLILLLCLVAFCVLVCFACCAVAKKADEDADVLFMAMQAAKAAEEKTVG